MSDSSLRPGSERRRLLRQERRADRLRNLWRLLLFSAMAAGLGYGLLRQGWTLNSPGQVEVSGSRLVGREQVIQAAGIRFPQPLLSLQPRLLAGTLSQALPVDNVRVSRLMLPPRLRVELEDRTAVARAERQVPGGTRERGYVDRQGRWISVGQTLGSRLRGAEDLLVVGWNPRHSTTLAQVLAHRSAFRGRLREIRFDPNGGLWLQTPELGNLRLGPADGQLERRLVVAAYLSGTLPEKLRGRRPRIVDLSDPEQPELGLAGVRPTPTGTPATAVKPQGGQ